jgi:hypothetical protein
MNGQTQPPLVHKHNDPSHRHTQDLPKPKNDDTILAKGTTIPSSLDIEENPFALGFDGPPLTAFGRKVTSRAPLPVPLNPSPSKTSDYISYNSKTTTTVSSGHHQRYYNRVLLPPS